MEEVHVDLFTVILSSIIYIICQAIWYAPALFGKWIPSVITMKGRVRLYLQEFVAAFVLSFFLALLLGFLGATSTIDGIYVAMGVWLGFIVPSQFSILIREKSSVSHYWVHIGFRLIGLVILGAILGS